MSVKQHNIMMLRRWSFSFFFVGFLTRRSLHRRNRRIRCVRRCAFRLFFVGVPNRRQPTCSKKNFTTVKRVHVWVEWSSWVEPGRERHITLPAMLCGSLTFDTAVAVWHCSCFFAALFPSCWTPSLCSTWVTMLPFEINLASYSMLLFASSTMRKIFSIGASIHLWVEWSIAKRESWAEQDSCSVSKATKFSAERECPSNAGLDS